ncbi:MAG: SMP-30/gluconolactonase/LRE family protein [Sneathiellaceae bacterium]
MTMTDDRIVERPWRVVAEGLRFPEGPIAMPDGSVLLVEIARGTLSRVAPDGRVAVVAETGGGPNGAALGLDGRVWLCNNGGFEWLERDGLLMPGLQANDYRGGRIEAVDPATGAVETVYSACEGEPLKGPNDLVFDADGGIWFTDHGKRRRRDEDRTGIFHAAADGSAIREALFPMNGPNGIGLSPDGASLYVAETITGRLWAFDLERPGHIAKNPPGAWPRHGRMLYTPGRYRLFDSLGVEACGNICVATLMEGGISVIAPDGALVEFVPLPDRYVTNICFGGADRRTAYVTCSSTGRLLAMDWPRPGLKLHFEAG